MSALTDTLALRPAPGGLKGWIRQFALTAAPYALGAMRRLGLVHVFGFYGATSHDDVREVFGTDGAFGVVYRDNLMVITDGQPFFLGLPDGPEYRAQLKAMRDVVLADDLAMLGDRAEALAEAAVAAAGGTIEVVSLIRQVTFGLHGTYFGVPEPAVGRLDVWATRLFEYQFLGSPKDTALLGEVQAIAPAFRAHIDAEIIRRKAAAAVDDILGRCLAMQAQGAAGYSDVEIRTALLCMVVGGPPQPPMVVPQAMEQLLMRPEWLAKAHDAAWHGDDAALHDIVLEAMRFDPLAPGLPRVALRDSVLAQGTRRAKRVPKGATILAGFAAAMMDGRRVNEPGRFIPGRPDAQYIHFGFGVHECFGRQINHATLHRMLKPLLRHNNVRRGSGRLRKDGVFAAHLEVRYD